MIRSGGRRSPQVRRQVLGEAVELAAGQGRVGHLRPLVELDDRQRGPCVAPWVCHSTSVGSSQYLVVTPAQVLLE